MNIIFPSHTYFWVCFTLPSPGATWLGGNHTRLELLVATVRLEPTNVRGTYAVSLISHPASRKPQSCHIFCKPLLQSVWKSALKPPKGIAMQRCCTTRPLRFFPCPPHHTWVPTAPPTSASSHDLEPLWFLATSYGALSLHRQPRTRCTKK